MKINMLKLAVTVLKWGRPLYCKLAILPDDVDDRGVVEGRQVGVAVDVLSRSIIGEEGGILHVRSIEPGGSQLKPSKSYCQKM